MPSSHFRLTQYSKLPGGVVDGRGEMRFETVAELARMS